MALVILAMAVAAAHAAPDAEPDAEHEAVRHLNLGIAAYRLGRYDEALRELTETDRLAPDRANTHRWLALVQAKLGDCKAALAHIEGYMARVSAGDRRLPELVELRDRCLGTATLVVDSTPAGAGVRIDGGPIAGTTPYRALGVHGGSHVVGVEKQGYETVTRAITMPATGELAVRVDLPVSKSPPRARSRWWLWAAGTAVVMTAVGVTYAVTRGEPDGRLPPIVCDAGACR